MWQRLRRQGSPCLPDCLVIGPQKAGTTWIHEYLRSRGDISVPRGVKETFFFDRNYHRGLKWYQRHFRKSEKDRYVVEVGASYFHCEEAPERIVADLGIVPLICTLRQPAERSFSLYLHLKRYGFTGSPFCQAIEELPEILKSSRYATILKRWISVFGRERLGVVFLETLAESPDRYVEHLCRHLDLPDYDVAQSLRVPVNKAAGFPLSSHLAQFGMKIGDSARSLGLYGAVNTAKRLGLRRLFFGRPGTAIVPQMTPEERAWVMRRISPELEELEDLLDVDLSHWKR